MAKTDRKIQAEIMESCYDLILQQQEQLARIMTIKNGKPLKESRVEVAYSASFIKWFAEEGKRVYGVVNPLPTEAKRIVVIKHGPKYVEFKKNSAWNWEAIHRSLFSTMQM